MKLTGINSLSGWLRSAAAALSGITDTPRLEARLILSSVLQKPQTWLIANGDEKLSTEQAARLDELLTMRAAGRPLPHLLGMWPFFGRDFEVSPDALIPRPETELLVEEALVWLRAHPDRLRAADVGAGSGCIAVSLAAEFPGLEITALDISPAALEVARGNIQRFDLQERVHPLLSDLLEAAPGPLDLVCANLPYIPTATLEKLSVADYEPRLALDGGADGLRLVERLLAQLPARLVPGGLALLEIEAGQGNSALDLAVKILAGWPARVSTDLAGLPRLLRIDSPEV